VSSVSLWFSPPCLRGGVTRAETGGSFCGRNFFVDRVWGSDSTWVDNPHDLGVAQACVERCGSTHPDPPTRIHPPGSTHPDPPTRIHPPGSVDRSCSASGRARPGFHAGFRRSPGLPQGRTLRGCGECPWGHGVFATGVGVFSKPGALYRFLQGRGGRRVRVGGLQSILYACAVAGDRGLFQVHHGPPVVPSRMSGPGWAPECGGLCERGEDFWG
jgi:hypothetical protein